MYMAITLVRIARVGNFIINKNLKDFIIIKNKKKEKRKKEKKKNRSKVLPCLSFHNDYII